ncbi:MAG: metallophosphoesterase [Gemmatimonadetes bacterium]|nr:metallophosphoesterase [Gemmatimonadota bacterium]
MTHHDDRDAERFDEQGNTRPTGSNFITTDQSDDGVDRRGFLRCMAWAGTATVWGMAGGIPKSFAVSRLPFLTDAERKSVFFAQISDSHIGFSKEANKDVTATLQEAVAKLNALPQSPAFVLHTGDITQLAKAEEFDTANEVLKGIKSDRVFYVPGEHDVATDNGASYLQRYGKGTKGGGWYSMDHSGVHFIGLVNVLNLKAGGLGTLGPDQIAWLKKDVAGLPSSTPIVLFAHVPLWTVYPEWGWGTDDSEQALGLLKRFGSVTVLNGHIHQIMQKVEGHMSFHTAMSTAFPQPTPGTAPAPGPMKVDADKLKSVLGIANVTFIPGRSALAVVDSTLSGEPPAFEAASHEAMMKRQTARTTNPLGPDEIGIDNFNFTPQVLTVKRGTKITWINNDDVPHLIVNVQNKFKQSPVLDTDQRFSTTLSTPGTYKYFCSLHPKMQGTIVVN